VRSSVVDKLIKRTIFNLSSAKDFACQSKAWSLPSTSVPRIFIVRWSIAIAFGILAGSHRLALRITCEAAVRTDWFILPLSKQAHDEYHAAPVAWEAVYGTRADLLLAFWASMGFKPGDFRTTGMNEKRAAWLCRVLNRVTHPA
jgi:hypothetical protein